MKKVNQLLFERFGLNAPKLDEAQSTLKLIGWIDGEVRNECAEIEYTLDGKVCRKLSNDFIALNVAFDDKIGIDDILDGSMKTKRIARVAVCLLSFDFSE